MSPRIQRLRAEIASDLGIFRARVEELAKLPAARAETIPSQPAAATGFGRRRRWARAWWRSTAC